jgi:hypothetical protein
VYVNMTSGDSWPQMHWLSIKRRDKAPIHDWRDLQRIKNDLIGEENEAVELYPAESRLCDSANQYHLWVLADPELRFPFGYNERFVAEGNWEGSKQRPFEVKPADCMDDAQVAALVEETKEKRDGAQGQDEAAAGAQEAGPVPPDAGV